MTVELLDFGDYPEIPCDGVGDVYIAGDRTHVMLFKWMKFEGVIRRVIAAHVIRPSVSHEEWGKWLMMLRLKEEQRANLVVQ